jgi:F0F1-type ATP synthase delta subunit
MFRPGDRVLVTVHHRLDPEQRKRLTRSIQRWAGEDVEVLLHCPLDYDLKVEHGNIIG